MLRIGIAKEGVCAEDPKGVDRHVALVPTDARRLVEAGCSVAVEEAAGLRLGFCDSDYRNVGVRIEPREKIYRNKDLLIRIKGPANQAIDEIDSGATLFCMAHLPMYPSRKSALARKKVNVVAMEAVTEHPFQIRNDQLAPRRFAKQVFDRALKLLPAAERHVVVIGYTNITDGMIRYLGRKELASLTVISPVTDRKEIISLPSRAIFLSDEHGLPESTRVSAFATTRGHAVFDFAHYDEPKEPIPVDELFSRGKIPEHGPRSIQCLHETGRAGAQFGLEVLRNDAVPYGHCRSGRRALVLGYGNVSMGAIDQCLREGATVSVLGRYNTNPARIDEWLKNAKLVINGAFIPDELAGIEYVLTNYHVRQVMKPGTVLIDLIGGSPTDRSPVESVDTCTSLSDPMVEVHDVKIASVFAWPNYYRAQETCLRYSAQIADVVTREKGLLTGLSEASLGIRNALVLGPFEGMQRETTSLSRK